MSAQRLILIGLWAFAVTFGATNVWAQDTGAAAAATEDAPAEDAAPAETTPEQTETPETEDDGPAVGENYIAARFTDWVLACENSGTGNDPCRFIQILTNGEGGRVAQVSVVPLPPGRGAAAAAIIETPLGTLLRIPQNAEQLDQPGGIRMKVDNGESRVFQFTFCAAGGCVAEIGMTEDLVAEFKRGNIATITIWSVDAPSQPVELQLSLSGFTAGFNRIAELGGAAPE